MRRIDIVKQQLSKSVQEKYLIQLQKLAPSNDTVKPASTFHITHESTQVSQVTNSSIKPLSAETSSLLVPDPISAQEQWSSVSKVAPSLFHSGNIAFPREILLIIAEFIGTEGLRKAASTNHAFNNLKCAFFSKKIKQDKPEQLKLKEIDLIERKIRTFLEKKRKELETLQAQLTAVQKDKICKKRDKKSANHYPPTLVKGELTNADSIEISLCWLLIQLSQISTMTSDMYCLGRIAFVFHDAYLCLQQNYHFSMGQEIDYQIHTAGLRAELMSMRDSESVIMRRFPRQQRLLNHYAALFAMLTNPIKRESIAAEVLEVVKFFKSNPPFDVKVPPEKNDANTEWHLKQYDKQIVPYGLIWTKNLLEAKAELKKQANPESSSANDNHSSRGLMHTVSEMLPSVFRR